MIIIIIIRLNKIVNIGYVVTEETINHIISDCSKLSQKAKAKIDKTQQNSKCKLCDDRNET